MTERLPTCHFSAVAQLATEEAARPPVESIGQVLAETQWVEVRLAVLEFHEEENLVVVADAIAISSSHSEWRDMNPPARLLNHFSMDWSIAAYSEADHYIRWQGGRGLGDVKILFKNEGHTREFLRAFTHGRMRAEEIANRDAKQLMARRYVILNALDRFNATNPLEGRDSARPA